MSDTDINEFIKRIPDRKPFSVRIDRDLSALIKEECDKRGWTTAELIEGLCIHWLTKNKIPFDRR